MLWFWLDLRLRLKLNSDLGLNGSLRLRLDVLHLLRGSHCGHDGGQSLHAHLHRRRGHVGDLLHRYDGGMLDQNLRVRRLRRLRRRGDGAMDGDGCRGGGGYGCRGGRRHRSCSLLNGLNRGPVLGLSCPLFYQSWHRQHGRGGCDRCDDGVRHRCQQRRRRRGLHLCRSFGRRRDGDLGGHDGYDRGGDGGEG